MADYFFKGIDVIKKVVSVLPSEVPIREACDVISSTVKKYISPYRKYYLSYQPIPLEMYGRTFRIIKYLRFYYDEENGWWTACPEPPRGDYSVFDGTRVRFVDAPCHFILTDAYALGGENAGKFYTKNFLVFAHFYQEEGVFEVSNILENVQSPNELFCEYVFQDFTGDTDIVL